MPRRRVRYSAVEKESLLARADEMYRQGAEIEEIAATLKVSGQLLREWFREQTISILFPNPKETASAAVMPHVTLF